MAGVLILYQRYFVNVKGLRRTPFGPARLKDADMTVDFESETTPDDIVSVIVTEPLTFDESRDIYQPGEWRLWRQGDMAMTESSVG